MSGEADLVWVFCTVAVRTSAGAQVGAKLLPRAEAAALVKGRRAVWGPDPPRGFS